MQARRILGWARLEARTRHWDHRGGGHHRSAILGAAEVAGVRDHVAGEDTVELLALRLDPWYLLAHGAGALCIVAKRVLL